LARRVHARAGQLAWSARPDWSLRSASLKVGSAELHDVPVVLHDPGPGIDGILGNTVLRRYRVTVDGDRRLLHLASR